MTPPTKALPNQHNARANTSPKSATGKTRFANARRHGLAIPIWSDATLAAEAMALAKHIAGAAASARVMAHAIEVADAQIEVVRVRRWRLDLMRQRLSDLENSDEFGLEVQRSLDRRGPRPAASITRSLREARGVAPQSSYPIAGCDSRLGGALGGRGRWNVVAHRHHGNHSPSSLHSPSPNAQLF